MTAEAMLARLNGVRETGHGKFVARCPAHDDRSPSLAIRECDDGRILIHCFAGCETGDVLAAVGMTFSDIMPERIGTEHSYKPMRQRFDARQVLQGVSHEIMVVSVIADRMAAVADEHDQARLMLAAGRLNNALNNAQSLGIAS